MTVQLANAPTVIPDIEALAVPTSDEIGRQRFASALRRHAIQDMSGALEKDFMDRVRVPAQAKGATFDDWRQIERAMEREASYRFYRASATMPRKCVSSQCSRRSNARCRR